MVCIYNIYHFHTSDQRDSPVYILHINLCPVTTWRYHADHTNIFRYTPDHKPFMILRSSVKVMVYQKFINKLIKCMPSNMGAKLPNIVRYRNILMYTRCGKSTLTSPVYYNLISNLANPLHCCTFTPI